MGMTDPIADLFTRLRNALTARHRTVDAPASRMKTTIVALLKNEGYVEDYEVLEEGGRRVLRIRLKYEGEGRGAIHGIERVSRPGRRVYRGKAAIPKVLDGLGVTFVSTPAGILTDAECRRRGVGGEILCRIW
jgi:small subunit ribosomal protein S8